MQRGARLSRPNVRVDAEVADSGVDADGEHATTADDENEIILERLEEEQLMAMQSDDDEEDDDNDETNVGVGGGGNVLDLRPTRSGGVGAAANGHSAASATAAVTTAMDTESWRLELERVLPQLKVVVRTDARDWRAHWEQMRTLKGSIHSVCMKRSNDRLLYVFEDITNVLEICISIFGHVFHQIVGRFRPTVCRFV